MGWGAFFRAVRRGEYKVSGWTWLTAVAALIYTISPWDFIPEFFFGPLGLADDAGVWIVLTTLVFREKHQWEARIAGGAHQAPGHAPRDTDDDSDIIDVEPY